MEVQRVGDAGVWLDRATPLLAADEARHNLAFGIADTLIRRPEAYPVAHLWLATEGENLVGAMLQTPPHNIILCRPATDDALHALVDAAAELGDQVPGVSGISPEVESFAEAWSDRTGGSWDARMRLGVYACTAVREVPVAPGAPRPARPGDLPTLVPMIAAFTNEVVPEPMQNRERVDATTRARLDDDPVTGGFWVWEDDGRVVSLSGHGGRTPTGIRVGPVYTPPADRGRGYATSLVATQTSWLLANAVTTCFLYTDLANPTSNAIYRRIGYERRHEALEIGFGGH